MRGRAHRRQVQPGHHSVANGTDAFHCHLHHVTAPQRGRHPFTTPTPEFGEAEPRVEVSADSSQLLPFLVAGTRRVALIQESLAAVLSGVAQVRVMRPAYDALPLQEAMWWHPVHTHDAAHVWLREIAARVGGTVTRADSDV
jgi:hypothetical protein